jgi:hypothetical protein
MKAAFGGRRKAKIIGRDDEDDTSDTTMSEADQGTWNLLQASFISLTLIDG